MKRRLRQRVSVVAMDVRPLRLPHFRRLWLSTAITGVGTQFTAVGIPVQLYTSTGSSFYVGISGLVAVVPLIIFGPLGGAAADRFDRRKLLLSTNVGIALTSLGLWLLALNPHVAVWPLFGLLAVQQSCFAINSPTRQAAIPQLVDAELLPAANALNSTALQAGQVIGPMLAGSIIPFLGVRVVYFVDVIALLCAFLVIIKLPPLRPGHRADTKSTSGRAPKTRTTRDQRRILGLAMFADLLAMVFGLPRALFPQLAHETFGGPVNGGIVLGLLYAAIPAGAIICGLVSGVFARTTRPGAVVVGAVCTWGVAVGVFGASHNLVVALIALVVAGAADMVSSVMRSSVLQLVTANDMQGRVQGIFTAVVSGGPRLGDLTHGSMAAVIGAGPTIIAGGLLATLITAAASVTQPQLWRYRWPPTSDVLGHNVTATGHVKKVDS
jgi:MFS family permease